MRNLWRLRGLRKERRAAGTAFELRVPSFDVAPGDMVALVGPSGCGKSTLLDVLAMILRPDAADELCFGSPGNDPTDVAQCWQRAAIDTLTALRREHVGYVLQTGGLLAFLNARENIELPGRLLGRATHDEIDRLAAHLGITAQLAKHPAQLSVGERQRVAIARALVHRPAIVLADEPTASVDPLNAARIMELFLQAVDQRGAALIIATHDADTAAGLGLRRVDFRLRREGDVTIAEVEA